MMSRASITYLLLLTIILVVQAGSLKRDNQDQIYRILDNTDSLAFDSANFPDFAVPVDFGPYAKKNNVVGSTNMLVVISNNRTVLSTSCLEFKPYIGASITSGTQENYTSPFLQSNFSGSGAVDLTLISNHWQLKTPVLFLNSCDTVANYIEEKETYGWIGLGFEGGSLGNYNIKVLFSIQINPFNQQGSLNFNNDSSLIAAATSKLLIPAGTDWSIQVKQLTFYKEFATTIPLIFDLQVESVLLPPEYLNFFTSGLSNFTNWACSGTVCTYTGNASDVRGLTILTAGDQAITIPASLFMSGNTLNFKAFSDDYISEGDTPIVLGWKFLAQYYSVFENQVNGPVIGLYKNPPITSTPAATNDGNTSGHAVLIVIAVIVIIIVAAVIYFTFFKNRRTTHHASVQRTVALGTELKGGIKNNADAANNLRL